ncbi:MAG: YhdP family protein [Pseudomonadota bacterium]|nr:YhdP family protein [Pseudomonadota bacterium]
MSRLLNWATRTLLWLAVGLVVLCAVFVGLARELVYDIGEFQPQVLAAVQRHTGLQLEAASLSGSWQGLAPTLVLYDASLRLSGSRGEPLRAQRVELELLLLRSLLQLAPRVRLQVEGARARLHYRDQKLVVSGFETAGGNRRGTNTESRSPAAAGGNALDQLLAQPRLALTDSELEIVGWRPQPVTLKVHRFQSEAGDRRRYVLGDFTLNGPSAIRFAARGRINGTLLRPHTLGGALFLEVAPSDWFPWLTAQPAWLPRAEFTSLQGGARVWVKLKAGVPEEVTSSFELSDLTLATANDIKPPEILKLQGNGRWRQTGAGDGWRLDVTGLRLQTSRFLWLPRVVQVHSQTLEQGDTRLRLRLDDADIEPWVNYYLGTQTQDQPLHQALSKLRPEGKLEQLALELTMQQQEVTDYRFAASLLGFQNRPWQQYPGLHDLEFKLWGERGTTLIALDEDYLELNYPHMFRDVIALTGLRGHFRLRQHPDHWQLQSDLIQARSHHLRAAAQLALNLPVDSEPSPYIRLQATLRDGDGQQAARYLPAGVLQDDLLQWLDQALVGGRLLRGDIVIHGPLRRDAAEPRGVLLGFTVADAELRFLPDWERPVRQALGDVVVDRGEVDAHLLEAEYYGQQLQRGRVRLPRYEPEQPHVLSVEVAARGPADQGFRILTQTPLRREIGDFIDGFAVNGDMAVDFSLDIPLQKAFRRQTRSVTRVTLSQGSVALPAQELSLTQVGADIRFDLQQGLSGHGIEARFLGGRLQGELRTTGPAGAQTVQLDFTGNTHVSHLAQWRPFWIWPRLSGPLDYQASLEIPLGGAEPEQGNTGRPGVKTRAPQLRVRSPLTGVVIDLPAPFGKPAGQPRPTVFSLSLGDEPTRIQLQHGELLQLALAMAADEVQRAGLNFGTAGVTLPGAEIFRISGVLPRFDDQEWRPVWQSLVAQQPAEDSAPQTLTDPTASDADSAPRQNPSLLYQLDDSRLRVQQLTLAGQDFGATELQLQQGPDQWQVQFANQLAEGRLLLPHYLLGEARDYPTQTRPVTVLLNRLSVVTGTPAAGSPAAGSGSGDRTVEPPAAPWHPADIDPATLPPLDLEITRFELGDSNLGRWTVQARPLAEGMALESFQAQVDGATLSGSGQWLQGANDSPRTAVKANLKGDNAADLIAAVGGTPTLSSEQLTAEASLHWPGAPFEFSLLRARGDINARLQEGVFFNVNNNAAGKIWGALNFETLLRRLQLNFDDIRESEMVYDELASDLRLDQGMLRFSRIKLNSPALKMQGKGQVNLASERIDMQLDVALPVTRNLVLPAAVIGGVPAAATAFVVEKILGEQFDKLTTIKYQLQGPIDQPEVTVRDSFSIIPKQVGEAVMRGEQAPAPAPDSELSPGQQSAPQRRETAP